MRPALGVEDDADGDAALVGGINGGIHDVFAAHHDFAFEQYRRAVFKVGEFAAKGRALHLHRLGDVALGIDDIEFEGGGGAEHFFGLGDVLDAGELDEEAVVAHDLDGGFGNAEAVDTAGHAHAVLVGGAAFHFADALFGVLHAHTVLAVFFELDLFEADRQQAVEGIQRLFAVVIAAEVEDDAAVCRSFRALHRDVVFRGGGGREIDEFGGFAAEEFVAVHLQQEGDAAAQVKAEVDRGEAEVLQPGGGVCHQVDRDAVVRVLGGEQVACLDLHVGLRVEEVEVLPVLFPTHGGKVGVIELFGDIACCRRRCFRSGELHLYGRAFAVPVRQGDKQAEEDHDDDEQVFPCGVVLGHGGFPGYW